MATVKIYPRVDRPNKQGLVSIQIEVQSKGSKVYHMIPTIKINPRNWDSDNDCVKPAETNYQGMNRNIEKLHSKVKKIVMDMEYSDQGFNKDLLKSKISGYDDRNFYDFWEQTLKVRGTNISFNTRRTYTTNFNKLKEYRRTLTFSDITLDFLEGLESWLRTEKNNKPNTIRGIMKQISYMVTRAKATLGVQCRAFDSYKSPSEKTYRQVVDLECIDKMLENLYAGTFKDYGGKAEEILATFCFQALTGLRFGDAQRFNPIEFIRDGNIRLCTDKTGLEVYIPLHGRLKKLLEFQKYSFSPGTNQAANRVIKSIGMGLGIKCKLTTHIAVHSFCTISLELGIPIEVISKVRGHANIRTTQIYTQVKNSLIEEQMKKWDRVE